MKNVSFFILAITLLLATSCNMEKRLYRNGWYIEKNKSHSFSATPGISQETVVANEIQPEELPSTIHPETLPPTPDTLVPAVENSDRSARITEVKQKIKALRKEKQEMAGDPGRMTYAQARASLAKHNCEPNRFAMTVYWMSFASIFASVFGFGLIVALVALLLSVFAINSVVAADSCVDANLAIIEAGKRMCYGVLIAWLILSVLTLLFVLILLEALDYI